MKQSAYLIQQRETRRRLVQAAERVTQQLMLDTLQVTLHQEFGFGYDRIKRLTDAWGKTYNQFHDALDGGTEADGGHALGAAGAQGWEEDGHDLLLLRGLLRRQL